LRVRYAPADLLDDYPLKPHELLRDSSDRVFDHLAAIAERRPDDPAWLLDDEGAVEVFTLKELADKGRKERINYRTVLLPKSAGGLRDGLLDGDSAGTDALDVSDQWFEDAQRTIRRRCRVRSDDPKPAQVAGMRLVLEIDTRPGDEETDEEDGGSPGAEEETSKGRYWRWYVRPRSADDDGSRTAEEPVTWEDHTSQVTRNATGIAAALRLPAELQDAVKLAARFHDLGKQREAWQRSIGNPTPKQWYAKSGKGWRPVELTGYRHEFGSLLDVLPEPDFQRLKDDHFLQDLVLHLIAAHHGFARPHFPPDRAFDPDPKGRTPEEVADIAAEVPRRFARLQRTYGRWGLAYLESLLRAADYAGSAGRTAPAGEGP
jgi:CRISPR-associated endonuclease/helicase Cas3